MSTKIEKGAGIARCGITAGCGWAERQISCSGLARLPTPTLVPGKLSQDMFLCQVSKIAKIGRGFELHITNLAPSSRWHPVDMLHDPKRSRSHGSCPCLLKNFPFTCMTGESFPKKLSCGLRLRHEFVGSEKFHFALGTTR
jgi:hypothetical protein